MKKKPEPPRLGRPSQLKTELARLRCAVRPVVNIEIARLICGTFMERGTCSRATYMRMEAGRRRTPRIVLITFRGWVERTNPKALKKISRD
jgi:hypothetical protein